MKRYCILLIPALFLTACSSSSRPSETPVSTPEAPVSEPSVNRFSYDGSPLHFLPEGEAAEYILNDHLTLAFSGKEEEQPYCQDTSCVIYRSVTLNGSDLSLFENMPVPVNEDYGACHLQKMDDLYFLSFANGAQINGIYAMLFNEEGEIIREFADSSLSADTEEENTLLHSRTNPDDWYSDSYQEKLKIIGEDIYSEPLFVPLFAVREDAEAINAGASKAVICERYDETLPEALEKTIYPARYDFMREFSEADIADSGAGMVFCIVPTDPDASVTVNSYLYGNTPQVIWQSDTGKPFLVSADPDTPYVEIVITDSTGTFDFPLTLEPGDLDYGDGIVHDFTFQAIPVNMNRQAMFDAIITRQPSLTEYAAGPDNFAETIILDGNLCYLAYFGTIQPNGWFTRERTFAVTEDGNLVYEYNVVNDVWYLYE